MENKIDITKLKAQDFMNELPEMVRSLEAVRSGSQDKKPVEVTFGELVTGKWGISEDELFEKMGINPKVDTMQNIYNAPTEYSLDCSGNHSCCYHIGYAPGSVLSKYHCI